MSRLRQLRQLMLLFLFCIGEWIRTSSSMQAAVRFWLPWKARPWYVNLLEIDLEDLQRQDNEP